MLGLNFQMVLQCIHGKETLQLKNGEMISLKHMEVQTSNLLLNYLLPLKIGEQQKKTSLQEFFVYLMENLIHLKLVKQMQRKLNQLYYKLDFLKSMQITLLLYFGISQLLTTVEELELNLKPSVMYLEYFTSADTLQLLYLYYQVK